MSYAAAKTITIDEIPVIDVHPLRSGNRQAIQEVARQLRQAAEGIGFFLHPQSLYSFSGDPAGICSDKTVFSSAERLEKPAEDQS